MNAQAFAPGDRIVLREETDKSAPYQQRTVREMRGGTVVLTRQYDGWLQWDASDWELAPAPKGGGR